MSEVPHSSCKLTIQILQKDGQQLQNFCRKCQRHGVNCFVEDHPSEVPQEAVGVFWIWWYWLFKLPDDSATKSMQQRRNSPGGVGSVFILGTAIGQTQQETIVELIGSAFFVTKRHLLTAHHNVFDENTNSVVPNLVISPNAQKVSSDVVFNNAIKVSLVRFSVVDDWAILEVGDIQHYSNLYFNICPVFALPNPSINEHEKLKCYYAPIGQFLQTDRTYLNIYSDDYRRVRQYDGQGLKKIYIDRGLYKGACGGPFVSHDGRVVALHLASEHEGNDISIAKTKKNPSENFLADKMDAIHEDLSNLSDSVYASDSCAFVICRSSGIMSFVDQELAGP